jgi:hypothetical protein
MSVAEFVKRPGLTVACVVALVLASLAGVMLLVHPDPASAANVSVGQCNHVNDTAGLTTTCNITIVNNLTDNPATTGSVVAVNGGLPTTSSDLVTRVAQCNYTGNGGGGTLTCNINITNNIAVNGAAAATGVTVNQCVVAGGPPGYVLGPPLPGNPDPCDPYPASTSGATITQCNTSGNGGGLVAPSTCDASGTVSSSLPILVHQCNHSVNGGGSKINCSTTITTNVIDTGATTTTAGSGGTTTTAGSGGTTTTAGSGGTTTTAGSGGTTTTAGSGGTTTTAGSGGTTTTAGSGGTTTTAGSGGTTTTAGSGGTTTTAGSGGTTTTAGFVGGTTTTITAGSGGTTTTIAGFVGATTTTTTTSPAALALTGASLLPLLVVGSGLSAAGLLVLGVSSTRRRKRADVRS